MIFIMLLLFHSYPAKKTGSFAGSRLILPQTHLPCRLLCQKLRQMVLSNSSNGVGTQCDTHELLIKN